MCYGKNWLFIFLIFNIGSAQAGLIGGGGEAVYDDVSKISWAADANLLGTLEASQGYDNIVQAIIADSNGVIKTTPNFYDLSGSHHLSTSDFSSTDLGRTDWWGAKAFINYLNAIAYAGVSHWALPRTPDNSSSGGQGIITSQLGELYYNEIGGIPEAAISDTHNANYNLFSNVKSYVYWSDTEYSSYPLYAWVLNTINGSQGGYDKIGLNYAWVVTSDTVVPAPLPSALYLFGCGILGLWTMKRR